MKLPFELLPALEAELRAAYADPPRAYHHFGHVEEVMEQHAIAPIEHPVETALAVLFHDAVYVPGRHDNEGQSAELARRLVVKYGLPGDIERIAHLILLTAKHGSLERAEVDVDAALFLDCDMAILGASPERFAEYDRAIRVEYSQVPDELYEAGRKAFLSRVLAKDRIYLSDFFHARLDAAARQNLRNAL